MQRLEERLLKNGNLEYFKMNGELKLDNDLLMDEMMRPIDFAFDKTMANATKETNAILQDRSHSFKKKYFRLDIVIGKIRMASMSILTEEERLTLSIRDQFRIYNTRTSFNMIPFYKQRIRFVEEEIRVKEGKGEPISEIKFLQQTAAKVMKDLDNEHGTI